MMQGFHRELNTLSTLGDVASLLDLDVEELRHYWYDGNNPARYVDFEIKKKSGGTRVISAPFPPLKAALQYLYYILSHYYQPPESAHGFVKGRSIISNAKPHCNQKYVFNLDLQDFFPTIHLGRVMGLLKAAPFDCAPEIATILGNLCCHNNKLPQGSPTSPIISNMICRGMDSQLISLARRCNCNYTRYADDITFSSDHDIFPSTIARQEDGKWVVGSVVKEIITAKHRFVINEKKVRMQDWRQRQEVTGLVTNVFPNVRRSFVREVRAMLHAWEKYGLDSARQSYSKKTRRPHRHPARPAPDFRYVLLGKILFVYTVKGADNPVSIQLRNRLCLLEPAFKSSFKYLEPLPEAVTKEFSENLQSESSTITLDDFRKRLRAIIRSMDQLAKEMFPLTQKNPNLRAYEAFFANVGKMIVPMLAGLAPVSYASTLAAEFGPKWANLSSQSQEQLALSHFLASTEVDDYLHFALLELCSTIESEIGMRIFAPLKGNAPPEIAPLNDKDYRKGHDFLVRYASNHNPLTLSQYSYLIKFARANPTYGLYCTLLNNIVSQYPDTFGRIEELLTDLAFAEKGKIGGLQQTIVEIRNACAHPGEIRKQLVTRESYAAIWEFALRKPLELLFLLTQPQELPVTHHRSKEKLS